MINCFLSGFISSNLTLRTRIDVIRPMVNIQKTTLIAIFKTLEVNNRVMDCSQ